MDKMSVSEIKQNGENCKVTVNMESKVMVKSFNIRQECEVETLTEEKKDNIAKHTFSAKSYNSNSI